MAQQLRLFTTPALKKQQEHIHTENTTARRLLSEELKDMVEQRQWVGQGQKWGREGGNKKKKNFTKEKQANHWRRLHPSLTEDFIGKRQDDWSKWAGYLHLC